MPRGLKQTRVGREHLAELDQVVLVAARAVEQQERARVVAFGRQVAMDVRLERVGHGRPCAGWESPTNVEEQVKRRAISPRPSLPPSPGPMDSVRLDKWLWAARFFKTRSLATDAIAGGKVDVNGDRAKPAKAVKPGDEIRLRIGPYEHILIVRELGERRGPASVAQTLYEETEASRAERERLAAQLKMAPAAFVYEEKGPPDEEGSSRPLALHRPKAPLDRRATCARSC